jgi:Domain of unknown function (DUF4386)
MSASLVPARDVRGRRPNPLEPSVLVGWGGVAARGGDASHPRGGRVGRTPGPGRPVSTHLNDVYVPSAFIVPGDATATARNIAAAELTYRLGILGGLLSNVVFLLLVSSLYDLLRDVDRKQARLMVILVSVGATLGIANLLNQIAPLILSSGAHLSSVFTRPQLDALALGFLGLRNHGTHVAMAFWGLWLLPFGLLVMRSGFLPRILGVLLVAGCFAYLAVSFTFLVLPGYRNVVARAALPLSAVGELATIAWLLVKGARQQTPAAQPSRAG